MTVEQFQEKFGIIGRSKEIKDLVDIVMHVAQSDISVLLYGESGTGKEVFARAIHGYSKRKNEQLISVNCGAIPEGILESELFGHKKGSFTGAIESRKGYFELADGGTLFLDEIAEMPLQTQVKLLRVIENKEFMRLGAETNTKVDVRIIAATNKDLQIEVDSKRFREDLYFRLKAVSLSIPPLRKRKEDIELLALHFLHQFFFEKASKPIELDHSAVQAMIEYDWPGNIRELKNVIETAAALNKRGRITADDLIPFFVEVKKSNEARNLPFALNKTTEEVEREFIYRALFELKKDLMELKDFLYHNHNKEVKIKEPELQSIEEWERFAIQKALKQTKGNKRKAAKLLGITERTLYRKVKEYGFEDL